MGFFLSFSFSHAHTHTHISIYDLIIVTPSIYRSTVFIGFLLEVMGVSPTHLYHKKVKALCISYRWHFITERQTVAQRCFVEPAHSLSSQHTHTHARTHTHTNTHGPANKVRLSSRSILPWVLRCHYFLQSLVFFSSSWCIKCCTNTEEKRV